MRRATLPIVALALLATGCKKPTPVAVLGFEEDKSLVGGEKMTFNVKTAPKARVETGDRSLYADADGKVFVAVPLDKVQRKPGGKGTIYLKVQPPLAARMKEFAGPVEFAWPAVLKVDEERVSCGSKLCTGTIEKTGTKVDMDVEAGATVEIDGQKLPVTAGKISATLDLGKRALAAPPIVLGKEKSSYKFEVPIVITFADKTKLEAKLPRTGEALAFVNTALGTIDKGPVRFGGEKEGPSGRKSVAVYSIIGSRVVGTAATVGDIDLVTHEKSSTRTLSCGTYRGQTTGKIISMDRTMYDEEVSVYDRRSGKFIGKRMFRADVPPCPSSMSSSDSLSGFPNRTAMDSWLKTFLK